MLILPESIFKEVYTHTALGNQRACALYSNVAHFVVVVVV